ncbi:ATP-dependent glucokinase [Pyrobaculum neutrophilum]|uniref:ROK family protein n=1 Tax=Pyrobaculum neutrophilum (strain DSM 2338 / JCM 9278 / NBRC 100436 / V24Sta) TaxID=444157 RepID=B1Y900_PYRNV|nr:ATP-dependent glucokinase [Pyrobaculum neutrophilum]ACB40229.1 ROK family protein [Pyrobaculum neutrophilum V24Sta]
MAERYLGVDIGATWTRVLLVDREGRVLRRAKFRTGVDPAAQVVEAVSGWEFDAVGVGSIGPLDLRSGWVVNSPNSPARRFPLVEPLKALGKPVAVANDCVAAVWGERVFKYGVENMVYVTLSTGVGVGAIVDGTLLLGKDGNAHELGHAVIQFMEGRRCGCGGRGHFEAYVGGAHIPSLYRELTGDDPLDPAEIFRRYREGEERARRFVDLWLEALAAGLATVAAAYDPELLIMGGSIALNNWDLISREVPRRLRAYLGVRPPELLQASFGDDEVAVGAAALVYKVPESLRRFGYPR